MTFWLLALAMAAVRALRRARVETVAGAQRPGASQPKSASKPPEDGNKVAAEPA